MVTKQLLKSILAASIAVSKDATRYHISHVRLEVLQESMEIIATNGNWLAHVTLSKDHAENLEPNEVYHFDAEAVKRLGIELKLAPKYAETLDIDLKRYDSPEVKYPNWRILIDRNATSIHTPIIGLSGEYLSDITKFFKQLGVKHPPLKLNITDALSAVTIESNTQDLGLEVKVILMSVRV